LKGQKLAAILAINSNHLKIGVKQKNRKGKEKNERRKHATAGAHKGIASGAEYYLRVNNERHCRGFT